MFQNCVDLLPGNTRKPLQKIVNVPTVLEILKKRIHGNACALKNPCAAECPRFSFNCRTVDPTRIHTNIISHGMAHLKFFMPIRWPHDCRRRDLNRR